MAIAQTKTVIYSNGIVMFGYRYGRGGVGGGKDRLHGCGICSLCVKYNQRQTRRKKTPMSQWPRLKLKKERKEKKMVRKERKSGEGEGEANKAGGRTRVEVKPLKSCQSGVGERLRGGAMDPGHSLLDGHGQGATGFVLVRPSDTGGRALQSLIGWFR